MEKYVRDGPGHSDKGGSISVIDPVLGNFVYTPPAGFVGRDSFNAYVSTTAGSGGPQKVFVLVTNRVPEAVSTEYYAPQGTPFSGMVDVIEQDGDAVTYRPAIQPAHGKLDLDENGSFTYTSDPNFLGVDAFTYFANDGIIDGGLATVYLNVEFAAATAFDIVASEVQFDSKTIKRDGGAAYETPQWIDNNADGVANAVGERSYPISYPRSMPGADTKVTVNAKFKVNGLEAGLYLIRGTSNGLASALTFEKEVTAAAGAVELSATMTSNQKMADTIDFGTLAIQWSISHAGQMDSTSSGNKAYITGANVDNQWETVLDVGSRRT